MKAISHTQLFIHSLMNPKMLAAYRILPVGKIIQYTFLLILLMTAFSLGQFVNEGITSINNYEEIEQYAENLQWLIYIISAIFSFTMNTLILYAKISLYALVVFLFAKPFYKRAEYRHLWRTAALAITWEVLLTIVLKFFIQNSIVTMIICMLITMSYLFIALSRYPKLKH